jgi:repressor LexA
MGKPGRPPAAKITEIQRRTLEQLRAIIAHRGYSPSVKELADSLGISHASAHEQITQLVRKGYLRREPGKARGIALALEFECIVRLLAVPIVGTVPAGSPVLCEENISGEALVDATFCKDGVYFLIECKGPSMTGAGIESGDYLLVREQPTAADREIVVALLNGEATVKRLSLRPGSVELRPENPDFKPISVRPEDDFRILGKVVAARNSFAARSGREAQHDP